MKKTLNLLTHLEKSIDSWFIITVLFIFAILRIPSLIEPDWYGDEGIYQVLGMAMRRGRMLYEGIWDNKPPLLYIIYSIFNGDLFSVRLLSLIFGIFSIICFFLLAKRILSERNSVYVSTLIFAILFAFPLLEGNIANAENFMLFPITLAAFFLIQSVKNEKRRNYIYAGVLLSLAFLIKIVALFDFLSFLTFLIIVNFHGEFSYEFLKKFLLSLGGIKPQHIFQKLFGMFEKEIYFVISFFIPIVFTSFFFLAKGAFSDYFKATFSQNVGYVGYGNYFLFPMGMMFLKIILLLSAVLFIFKMRRNIGFAGVFIFIWMIFSIFNALFSERPYTHYLLVLLPSVSLFVGLIIKDSKLRIFNIAIILFMLFIFENNFHAYKGIYKKTVQYYGNFINFVLGDKNVVSYQSFFDQRTPRDYDLVNFIKENTKENEYVFLWSDSAQVYALSNKIPPGRYAVAYHITFYKEGISETEKAVQSVKPKYIIATKDTGPIEKIMKFYKLKLLIKGAKIYEREI